MMMIFFLVSFSFEIFDQGSRGSLHHFSKMFGELLSNEPLRLLGFLTNKVDDKNIPIIMKMMGHIHQSVIGSLFIDVVGMPVSTDTQRTRRRQLLELLASQRFIEVLFENLKLSGKFLRRKNSRKSDQWILKNVRGLNYFFF